MALDRISTRNLNLRLSTGTFFSFTNLMNFTLSNFISKHRYYQRLAEEEYEFFDNQKLLYVYFTKAEKRGRFIYKKVIQY